MSAVPAERFFDPVTRLVIELTAYAKPRDSSAFVDLLQRFTEALAREVLENADEVRARLGIGKPAGDYTINSIPPRCPYCYAEIQEGHECDRMRELGFEAWARSGSADNQGKSSTGAAEADSKADTPTRTAATEAPAAPSKSSPGRRMTPEQVAQLRAAYDDARDHAGNVPYRWITEQSRALGFSAQSIDERIGKWRSEPRTAPVTVSAQQRAEFKELARSLDAERGEHTNSHACWCRKKPGGKANPWCKLAPPSKPIASLAGLTDPRPRRERYVAGRAE
jgi:hypothetical protein